MLVLEVNPIGLLTSSIVCALYLSINSVFLLVLYS